MDEENQKPIDLTDTLLNGYKKQFNEAVALSVQYKHQVNNAKTTLKKKYFQKKLERNNQIVMKIATKINMTEKMSEGK